MNPLSFVSASKSSISSTDLTPVQSLLLSADILKHNNTMNHDLSGTSSARPSKMGEKGNGPSHRPLAKVTVRFKENLRKLSVNQKNLAMKPNIIVPL